MYEHIHPLQRIDFHKCANVWDIEKNPAFTAHFVRELENGNRTTYVYDLDGAFVGEISLVRDMQDPDYTVANQRVYLSRLVVKDTYRRRGIGRELVSFACKTAKDLGYREISVGVDLDNYGALRLYAISGFHTILFVGEDSDGQYLKLLKHL